MRSMTIGSQTVGEISLLEGAQWPKTSQLLIEKGSVAFTGVALGDKVEFETSNKKHPVLTVSGVAHDLNSVVPMMTGRSVAYVELGRIAGLRRTADVQPARRQATRDPHSLAQVTAFGVAFAMTSLSHRAWLCCACSRTNLASRAWPTSSKPSACCLWWSAP